jgi:hypothetical protein
MVAGMIGRFRLFLKDEKDTPIILIRGRPFHLCGWLCFSQSQRFIFTQNKTEVILEKSAISQIITKYFSLKPAESDYSSFVLSMSIYFFYNIR